MNTNTTGSNYWDPTTPTVTTAMQSAAGAIRVAQNIFYVDTSLSGQTTVPADIFHPDTMSITEGETKPFIEISSQFRLTNGQAANVSGTTGMTLATFAARSMALVEDLLFFRGHEIDLPPTVRIESGRASAGKGLFGLAHHEIRVKPADGGNPANSGLEILAAVLEGVSILANPANLQPPKYALILDNHAYAAIGGSTINGNPTLTALGSLTAMLTEQIYETGALPAYTGLLVSLGGDVGQPGGPTTIYVGSDVAVELTTRESNGLFLYRVFERVQIVARDPRAYVKLDFGSYRRQPAPSKR
jgi:uncharacterized linocin/CFP29 family protein